MPDLEGNELDRPIAEQERIFAVLARHAVEYLVAGGTAVVMHGFVRFTRDLDIIPSPSEANMVRLAAALVELDAYAVGATSERLALDLSHPASLAVGNYFLTTRFGALDLFNRQRPDLKRYRRLAEAAIEFDGGGVQIKVIGKDDLIAMKREAGRPKDLADIAALTEVERNG